jgi:2-succinyl-6-hydroxy-2,4-cyclohexadiene-1-carboxylate synthase
VQAPLVVFVPGFMQRGEAWAPVAGIVSESYTTLCVDFAANTLAGRLDELRAAAPPGAVAVGYSMGGRLALQLAAREPERFGALVTVGAAAGIEDPGERRARREADEALATWIEGQPIEAVVERWESQPVFAGQSPELVEAQRAGRRSHRPGELAELLRSAGQGAAEPVWERIGSLPMPLLAIAGERDERYAAAARRLAELAPRGRCELVPGAGHAAHLERPDAVAELILGALASWADSGSAS